MSLTYRAVIRVVIVIIAITVAVPSLSSRRDIPADSQDYNRDGFDDAAIGVPGEDIKKIKDAGSVSVIYGSRNGFTVKGNQFLHLGALPLGKKNEQGARFGDSLGAGDVNGDGFSDLVIGIPFYDNVGNSGTGNAGIPNVKKVLDAGALVLVPGSAKGLNAQGSTFLSLGDSAKKGDHLGMSVYVADIDGDGQGEIIAGAPGRDKGKKADVGAIAVFDRDRSGGSRADGFTVKIFDAGSPGIPGRVLPKSEFGAALTAGFFNPDEFMDLVVGSPGYKNNRGAIHVIMGSRDGFSRTGNFLITRPVESRFGSSLTTFSRQKSTGIPRDPNFERDKIIVGAPSQDVGGKKDAGVLYAIDGRRVQILTQGSDAGSRIGDSVNANPPLIIIGAPGIIGRLPMLVFAGKGTNFDRFNLPLAANTAIASVNMVLDKNVGFTLAGEPDAKNKAGTVHTVDLFTNQQGELNQNSPPKLKDRSEPDDSFGSRQPYYYEYDDEE